MPLSGRDERVLHRADEIMHAEKFAPCDCGQPLHTDTCAYVLDIDGKWKMALEEAEKEIE